MSFSSDSLHFSFIPVDRYNTAYYLLVLLIANEVNLLFIYSWFPRTCCKTFLKDGLMRQRDDSDPVLTAVVVVGLVCTAGTCDCRWRRRLWSAPGSTTRWVDVTSSSATITGPANSANGRTTKRRWRATKSGCWAPASSPRRPKVRSHGTDWPTGWTDQRDGSATASDRPSTRGSVRPAVPVDPRFGSSHESDQSAWPTGRIWLRSA